MKMFRVVPVAVAALAVTSLSGCAAFSDSSGQDASSTDSTSTLKVAAAFYPLQYVADRVAGDLAEVESITPPGKDSHDLELTVRETALIAESDLVIHESDFQPAVDDGIEQNSTGAVIDAAEVVELQPAAEGHSHDDEHAEEEGHTDDEAHADEDEAHADEEEAHTEDDGHDHGEFDPHFWLDPIRMATLGDAVADKLSEIDADHADEYAANAADLRTDLETLDAAYTSGLETCERDTVVVSHDAFGYLTRYGLHFDAVNGLTPDAEPTPADLAALQKIIRAEGVTTVFSERLASPRLTESLAADLGISTAILDPIEGLSDETAEEDYLSLMEQNLSALQEANACS